MPGPRYISTGNDDGDMDDDDDMGARLSIPISLTGERGRTTPQEVRRSGGKGPKVKL